MISDFRFEMDDSTYRRTPSSYKRNYHPKINFVKDHGMAWVHVRIPAQLNPRCIVSSKRVNAMRILSFDIVSFSSLHRNRKSQIGNYFGPLRGHLLFDQIKKVYESSSRFLGLIEFGNAPTRQYRRLSRLTTPNAPHKLSVLFLVQSMNRKREFSRCPTLKR